MYTYEIKLKGRVVWIRRGNLRRYFQEFSGIEIDKNVVLEVVQTEVNDKPLSTPRRVVRLNCYKIKEHLYKREESDSGTSVRIPSPSAMIRFGEISARIRTKDEEFHLAKLRLHPHSARDHRYSITVGTKIDYDESAIVDAADRSEVYPPRGLSRTELVELVLREGKAELLRESRAAAQAALKNSQFPAPETPEASPVKAK